jgi:hypothetical protein
MEAASDSSDKPLLKPMGPVACCRVGTLHRRPAQLVCLDSPRCACFLMTDVQRLTMKLGML